MKSIRRFACVMGLVFALAGCAAAQLTSEGKQLQERGELFAAALKYEQALEADKNHDDARKALFALAKPAYDKQLAVAVAFEDKGDIAAAVPEYEKLENFLTRLHRLQLLQFDVVDVHAKVGQLRNAAAEERYRVGQDALARGLFDDAIVAFKGAQGFAPRFRDTDAQIARAHVGLADKAVEGRSWRAAIGEYLAANAQVGKDFDGASAKAARVHVGLARAFVSTGACRQAVRDLEAARKLAPSSVGDDDMKGARACAAVPVAIVPFANPTKSTVGGMALPEAIVDQTSAALKGKASDHLQLLDATAIAQLMKEGLTTSGPARGKKLTGVKMLVLGQLTQVGVEAPRPVVTKKSTPWEQPCEGEEAAAAACTQKTVQVQYVEKSERIAIKLRGSVRVVDVATGEQRAVIPLDVTVDDSVRSTSDFRLDGKPFDVEKLAGVGGSDGPWALSQAARPLRSEADLAHDVVVKVADKIVAAALPIVDADPKVPDPSAITLP